MRKDTIFLAALAATVAVAVPAFAADGALDPSFGDAGRTYVSVGDDEYRSAANDVALDAAGRAVLVGRGDNGDGAEWGLTRLGTDGRVDETFGFEGRRTDWIGNGGTAHAVALQGDGKIVVAGDANRDNGNRNVLAVARYLENGQFDDSFGENQGHQLIDAGDPDDAYAQALDVKVLSDGDIAVAGFSTMPSGQHMVVARLNPDGTPDTQFGGGLVRFRLTGYVNRALALAELPGGRLVAGGFAEQENGEDDLAFASFTRNGLFDGSFSGDGSLVVPLGTEGHEAHVESLAVDGAGRIVAAGSLEDVVIDETFALRLTPAGELDDSFGTGGIVRTPVDDWSVAHDVAVQPDGRILVAGAAGDLDYALVRLDEDGARDATFGTDGIVREDMDFSEANALALTADGTRAVVAGGGGGEFAAARFVLGARKVVEEPKGAEEDDKGGDIPKQDAPKQEQPKAGQPAAAVVVPRGVSAPRRCTSRRVFTINLRRLGIVRGDAVFRGKKAPQSRLKGTGRTIRVDLRRLAAGRYAVDVTGLTKSGRKVTITKRYWTCRPRR